MFSFLRLFFFVVVCQLAGVSDKNEERLPLIPTLDEKLVVCGPLQTNFDLKTTTIV